VNPASKKVWTIEELLKLGLRASGYNPKSVEYYRQLKKRFLDSYNKKKAEK